MTKLEQERLFADMARAYVRADGAALLREAAALPPPPPTPQLDARVRGMARRRGWVRWVPGAAAMAAGLLLAVFLGSPALRQQSHAPDSAAPPLTNADVADGVVLPLSFSLPENLTVSTVGTDRGQTIYRLTDALNDDVVLTLELAEPDFRGLQAVALGDEIVYVRAERGYRLLTFAHDGVVYAMTCRYEMDTLAKLAEQILL